MGRDPVRYCDADWAPGRECPIFGQADPPGIISLVGGGPNEVFVGYQSYDNWTLVNSKGEYVEGTWEDPQRHDGKVDRVRLATDGTLIVDRFDFVSYNTPMFWHDRSALRMIFDHFVHPHELYVGTEHGIDRVQPDNYSMPPQQASGKYESWFLHATFPWLGDHLHPRVCYHQWCSGSESRDGQRMGDWLGLALDAKGDLWVGGRWAAGKILWVPKNVDKYPDGTWWIDNPPGTPADAPQPQGWPQRGGKSYGVTFGDPWCGSAGLTSVYDPSYTDAAIPPMGSPSTCHPPSGSTT